MIVKKNSWRETRGEGKAAKPKDFIPTEASATFKHKRRKRTSRHKQYVHLLCSSLRIFSSFRFLSLPHGEHVRRTGVFWAEQANWQVGQVRVTQVNWDILPERSGGLRFRRMKPQTMKHNFNCFNLTNNHFGRRHLPLPQDNYMESSVDFQRLTLLEWIFVQPPEIRKSQITGPSLIASWHPFRSYVRFHTFPLVIRKQW